MAAEPIDQDPDPTLRDVGAILDATYERDERIERLGREQRQVENLLERAGPRPARLASGNGGALQPGRLAARRRGASVGVVARVPLVVVVEGRHAGSTSRAGRRSITLALVAADHVATDGAGGAASERGRPGRALVYAAVGGLLVVAGNDPVLHRGLRSRPS
jgi:hypothetical protein